ncbi:MAG: hypothetical protein GF372_11745 [Candidatus Marinimicrobia bacterium]|nr:hypothetical protein [Candidatus Neomarinimicrobiota bacterium]
MVVDTQIELYHFEECPYCEKVRRALDYYDLDYKSHIIDPADRSEVEEISGQSLVPVIVDGYNVVHDSTEIIKYLDEHYSNSRHLVPEKAHEKSHAFIWNEFCELSWGTLGYRAQKGTDKSGNKLSSRDMENLQSEINRESQLLDDYLTETEFLVGNEFSIADIAMSSFISRMMEFSDFDISEQHKNIWDWFERVNEIVEPAEVEIAEA